MGGRTNSYSDVTGQTVNSVRQTNQVLVSDQMLTEAVNRNTESINKLAENLKNSFSNAQTRAQNPLPQRQDTEQGQPSSSSSTTSSSSMSNEQLLKELGSLFAPIAKGMNSLIENANKQNRIWQTAAEHIGGKEKNNGKSPEAFEDPSKYASQKDNSRVPNRDGLQQVTNAFKAQGNTSTGDKNQTVQKELTSEAARAAKMQLGGADKDITSSTLNLADKDKSGADKQSKAAADLQEQVKQTAFRAAVVEVLKKISGLIGEGLGKFEKFNDELRRTYKVSGDTSTKIMDATLSARSSVKDSLGIHISTDESIKAIKEQILNNGVNAAHLNKSTQEMVVGLSKFGVKLDKNALMTLDNMNMSTEQQKMMMDQFMAMSSGENTFRADVSALSKDFKAITAISVAQGKTNEETAKAISGYSKDVQKLMSMGINQQEAQKMVMADLKRNEYGHDTRANNEEWLSIQNIVGIRDANMSTVEFIKEARETIKNDESARARLEERMANLRDKGDEQSYDMIMKLDNILNGREGHMVEAGSEEAKEGYAVPKLEQWKDDFTAKIGEMSTGLVSKMWGVAGQGTLQDIVKKGFELVIAAINFNSLKEGFGKTFTKVGDILGKVGKTSASTAEGVANVAGNTGKLSGLFKGGLGKVVGALKAVAGPVAAIAGVVVAIAAVVKGIKAWMDAKEADKDAQKELDNVTAELKEAKERAELAKARGNSAEAKEYERKIKELQAKQDEIAGNRIDARKNLNEGKGKAIGAGSGALAGAGIGAAVGSIIPGVGTLIGAGIGAGVGALAGYFGGGAIGSAVSDENTAEQRALVKGSANSGTAYYNSNGSIIDSERVTHVGEGGKVEVILPATKPERMLELSAQMAKRSDISEEVRKSFDVMHKSLTSQIKHNENGSVVDKETVTHVGEGNKPEAIMPATDPARMQELSSDMANRSDIPKASQDAFSAMNSSLSQGGSTPNATNATTPNTASPVNPGAGEKTGTLAEKIIQAAKSMEGVPYRDGGDSFNHPERGLVCNMLVEYAYHAAGVDLKKGTVNNNYFKGINDWVFTDEPTPGGVMFTNWVPSRSKYGGTPGYTHINLTGFGRERIHASAKGRVVINPDFMGKFNANNIESGIDYEFSKSREKKGLKKPAFAYLRGLDYGVQVSMPSEVQKPAMGGATPTTPQEGQGSSTSSPVNGNQAQGAVQGEVQQGNAEKIVRSTIDIMNAFEDLKHSSKVKNRRGILNKSVVAGILEGKVNSYYTSPVLQELLEHNYVDISQSKDPSIGYSPLKSLRLGDEIPATFGSLDEGFEDYLSSIERYYGKLRDMSAHQQLTYLQNNGVLPMSVAKSAEMSEAMLELAKEMKELKQEVKEQNTTKKLSDMRNVNMPIRPISRAI